MSKRFLFRWGEKLIHSKAAIFLLPFSWIWKGVSTARHFLYDSQFFRTHRVSRPVVSIGNLAVGGTGKTPLVIALARQFAHRKVAICSRGYGCDESHVMQRHLPFAKIYEDKDRVRGSKKAIKEGAELIILDDGFQHRRLWKDFDLLLVRPKDLKGHCLPAGDLRDSKRRIAKADTLFFHDPLSGEKGVRLATKVRRILTLQGQEVKLRPGEPVGIFCGIANPERFKKTIVDLGVFPVAELMLADHEPIGESRLDVFYEKCKLLKVRYLICTEKDAVKLPLLDMPILYVEIESIVVDGAQEWQNLIAKIEQRMNN